MTGHWPNRIVKPCFDSNPIWFERGSRHGSGEKVCSPANNNFIACVATIRWSRRGFCHTALEYHAWATGQVRVRNQDVTSFLVRVAWRRYEKLTDAVWLA